MTQKSIHIQTQGVQMPSIGIFKPVGFVAINADNVKITLDAYIGLGRNAEPRTDCLVEVVDQFEVFELTPELLIKALRYYCEYAPENDIVQYRNKNHYIVPDAVKPLNKLVKI